MSGSKMWCIYTMEYYAEEGKKEILPFVTAWVVVESIMLSEVSPAVKDEYHIVSPLTRTQSQKEKRKQNITRDTESKNNLTVTRGEVGGDNGGKGFPELLQRTHGQNHGEGWKQRREVGLFVGWRGGEKMQTAVIEQ